MELTINLQGKALRKAKETVETEFEAGTGSKVV
jgi:hypothetical protein